ncbi:MAG: hypothetical protein AABY81_04550 [Pseudomonadota bacterium]
MRYLIMIIMYVLLANPIGVSAATPDKLSITGCQLFIVSDKDGTFIFKMGDSLTIKATSQCLPPIKTELDKTEASRVIRLFLDNVSMTSLPASVTQVTGTELALTFQLARRSSDDDNRKEWDTLLGKWHRGYVMTMPVALAVGNGPAWSVSLVSSVPSALAGTTIQLTIAEEINVRWALGVGLVILLFAYYFLIKNPTALRDGKDGYYSLGKSQMAFWGLLVVLTFTGIWCLTGTMEQIPLSVLTLLGISGATGLSAIVIGENKKSVKESELQTEIIKLREEQQKLEKEQLTAAGAFPQVSEARLVEIKSKIDELSQQPVSVQSAGFLRDICDDGNGLSFHRLQVVIWTMVLGVVFIGSVARVMSMPEFSETLLILLGISNGTYLGFKFPEKS